MTTRPADLRTETGVCPRCGDTRLIPIGDGYSVNPCPNCTLWPHHEAGLRGNAMSTDQQPAQPLDMSWVPTGDGHPIEQVKAGCDPVTGQPAQPGSGEVVPRSRYDACNRDWLEEKAAHERTRDAAAKEIDRLQSALTATRAELTQRQDRIGELRIELDAAQQDAGMWEREYRIEHGRVEQLTGELLAAQQRIAALHAALRTYGWHKPECDYMQEELPCTCGFMDAGKEQGNG